VGPHSLAPETAVPSVLAEFVLGGSASLRVQPAIVALDHLYVGCSVVPIAIIGRDIFRRVRFIYDGPNGEVVIVLP
jgi:hypothetical protein